MKLEYGKRYVQRNGMVTAPLVKNENGFNDTHPFWDPIQERSFQDNGKYLYGNHKDALDIIAPYESVEERHEQIVDAIGTVARKPHEEQTIGFCPPMMKSIPEPLGSDFLNVGSKDQEILQTGGTQFDTGAVRSGDANTVMYQLISPIGLRRIAETMKEGFDKYGAYNLERGMPIGDIMNHAIRHMYMYLSGDRSEDHLAHATWNLMAAMHMEETHPELEHGLRPIKET